MDDNNGKYDKDNIFAKILRGEIPSHKIYEDGETFAFLDIMPRSKGHSLVIPKKPAVNMLDIEPDDLCALMRSVHMLAPVIKKAMGADGFMIQQFNGAAAGQMVFHIHFHIVPRYEGVPLKPAASEMEREDILISNAEAIRKALAKTA
jgi:histidine triad (HIT) family protein